MPFPDEILVTPVRGCLLGITRKKIFEAVKKYGGDLKIEERDIGKIKSSKILNLKYF